MELVEMIKRLCIIGAVWIAFYYVGLTLFGVAHAYLRFPQNYETVDLDEVIANEEEFPVGEYVTLKVHYPLGVYADNVIYPFWGNREGAGSTGFSPGTDYYYITALKDHTFISLLVCNKEEKRKLDAQVDLVTASIDLNSITDHVLLKGKLRNFYVEEKEIKGYYEELITLLGFETTDPRIRMYVLDTTEIALPSKVSDILMGATEYIIPIGIVLCIIPLILLRRQDRRKKMEQSG